MIEPVLIPSTMMQVMTFLANKGPALETFVCGGLVSLLARITKLGWFETSQQDVTKDVSQFLTASVDHCIIGLQVQTEPCFVQYTWSLRVARTGTCCVFLCTPASNLGPGLL